ncbi:MAG: hypothetical protein IPN79_11855 [Saprospiraceae bacterium]|nr:hypothetical protein [Saprospiraceae bacterium]
MKILLITLILIMSGRLYAQFDNFYFGVDFGLIRDINQVVSNDNDYFSCWNNCWSDQDGFFSRNGSFSLFAGFEISDNMIFEINFVRQTENVSIQYLLPLNVVSGGGISGSGIRFSNTLLKWTAGVGRKISIGNELNYIPFFQLSTIYTDNLSSGIFFTEGPNSSFRHNFSMRYFNENQIFLGFKNTLQWKPSSRWSINLQLGYAQGLSKIYEIHQEIQFFDDPENISKGHTISRLSHIFASLGTSYIFKKN